MELNAGTTFICTEQDAGKRADIFLHERLDTLSRSALVKWISDGLLLLNDKPFKKNAVLNEGDRMTLVTLPEPEPETLEPEDIPLDIVYEDEELLVINKPKGLICHPGHGARHGTLVQGLLHHCRELSSVGGPMRPGLVHRLDKDTSGLLLAAKNDRSHLLLARQLEERTISRVYHALVWREMGDLEGTLDFPLGRHLQDPVRRAVRTGGKTAITHFSVLENYELAAYLEARLQTGRTHQIRVHFSHVGHPIVGDVPYGGGRDYLTKVTPIWRPHAARLIKLFPTQALHAHRLTFIHPMTGQPLTLESPLPEEMQAGIALLKEFGAQQKKKA